MTNEALLGIIIDFENAEKIVSGSNHNYKVTPKGETTPVFVTLFDEQNLGRITKSVAINTLLTNSGIPTPLISEYGTLEDGSRKVGYLVRDFVEGRELHQEFNIAINDKPKFGALVAKFGQALSDLHLIKFDSYGNIACASNDGGVQIVSSHPTWTNYVDVQVSEIANQVDDLADTTKIGDVHSADLIKLGKDFGKLHSASRAQLGNGVLPRFIHNDLLLSNVLIAGDTPIFIDYEWSISGDTAADLAQLENWVEFTKYGPSFSAHSESFIKNYSTNGEFPKDYAIKRQFYYFQRSLVYLLAAFSESFTPEYQQDPRLVSNVTTHFNLMDRIVSGRGNIGVLNI